MPIAHLEPTHHGPEAVETTPIVTAEPALLPAVTLRLVPYAMDEVEWYPADEYPVAS